MNITQLSKLFRDVLLIIVIGKLISVSILPFLPSQSVEIERMNTVNIKYSRYDIENLGHLDDNKEKNNYLPVKKIIKEQFNDSNVISDMLLKGIYISENLGKYVIVSLKSTPNKTSFLEIGETFGKYKLIEIGNTSVVFQYRGAKYILHLASLSKPIEQTDSSINVNLTNSLSQDEGVINLSKTDIRQYSKNVDEIFRNISVLPIRDGKNLIGFKVKRVSSNPPFSELGLQKGDLILKINNKVLKDFSEVMEIYKNINDIDILEMQIKRDNIIKDITYEIN